MFRLVLTYAVLTLTLTLTCASYSDAATISGTLFDDRNGNGSWDTGDGRLSSWWIYVDLNNNSIFDAGEPNARTNINGLFTISGLAAGTYVIRQAVQDGWRQTFPTVSDHANLTLSTDQTGSVTFGASQAMSAISGSLFNDINGNGALDPDESLIQNWSVFLDSNNNGVEDINERWTTTGATGSYSFDGLPSGTYRLRLTPHHGWTQTLGNDSYIVTVDGSNSRAEFDFAVRQDAEPTMYSVNNLVSYFLIGASGTILEDRRVAWNIKAEGWKGFVSKYIQPQLSWGAKRIMLHNPCGTLPNENMRADQCITAREQGLNWLTDDFVEAWQPITSQGIEVIAYFGSMKYDPTFQGLNDTNWWARFWDAFSLPINAGMSIAFDASEGTDVTSRDWQAIVALHSMGIRTYGEPRAPRSSMEWRAANAIAEDQIWQAGDPEKFPAEQYWAAKDSQITGEVLRLMSQPPSGESWATASSWSGPYARRIMREGHSALLTILPLVNGGVTLQQVLTADPTPTPTPTATPTATPTRTSPSRFSCTQVPTEQVGRSITKIVSDIEKIIKNNRSGPTSARKAARTKAAQVRKDILRLVSSVSGESWNCKKSIPGCSILSFDSVKKRITRNLSTLQKLVRSSTRTKVIKKSNEVNSTLKKLPKIAYRC